MLTQEEKDAIREEVRWREEVRQEIIAAKTKHQEGALMAFLNSPFFVSVVAAALIGMVGYWLQDVMATHQQERARYQQLADRADERERALQAKKLALLSLAAERIDSDITNLCNMRLHMKKLAEMKSPGARDEIGRTRDEVTRWNDYFVKLYVERPKPAGLFAEIHSVFGDEVRAKSNELRNVVRILEENDELSVEQIQNAYDNAKTLQPDLIDAMGKEILGTTSIARSDSKRD